MQRTGIRQSVPQGQDREQVRQIVDTLCRHYQLRAAAIVLLARATCMRLREAILADLPRLNLEARDIGKINTQNGTKGGRSGASAPRWITVNDAVRVALGYAEKVSPEASRNLIAPHESYLHVLQDIIRPARDILHGHNLKGFHELRAAYACERYEQITQHRAPINGGHFYTIDRRLDQEARMQISLRARAWPDRLGGFVHWRTGMTKDSIWECSWLACLQGHVQRNNVTSDRQS